MLLARYWSYLKAVKNFTHAQYCPTPHQRTPTAHNLFSQEKRFDTFCNVLALFLKDSDHMQSQVYLLAKIVQFETLVYKY